MTDTNRTPRPPVAPLGDVFAAVGDITAWLDAANPADAHEDSMRVLKLVEEAGEAAAAYIGMTGQNPRKGVTHTREDLIGELADVAITALCAIQHFTQDTTTTRAAMLGKLARVIDRAQIPRLPTDAEQAATKVLHTGGTLTITYDSGENGSEGYPAFYGVDGHDRDGRYVAAGCSRVSPADAFASLRIVSRDRAADLVHAFPPIDYPGRVGGIEPGPRCGARGRTALFAADVTCPDCRTEIDAANAVNPVPTDPAALTAP